MNSPSASPGLAPSYWGPASLCAADTGEDYPAAWTTVVFCLAIGNRSMGKLLPAKKIRQVRRDRRLSRRRSGIGIDRCPYVRRLPGLQGRRSPRCCQRGRCPPSRPRPADTLPYSPCLGRDCVVILGLLPRARRQPLLAWRGPSVTSGQGV